MPDIAVAAVLIDAVDDGLDGVDLWYGRIISSLWVPLLSRSGECRHAFGGRRLVQAPVEARQRTALA